MFSQEHFIKLLNDDSKHYELEKVYFSSFPGRMVPTNNPDKLEW